jgi:hypothetical protein
MNLSVMHGVTARVLQGIAVRKPIIFLLVPLQLPPLQMVVGFKQPGQSKFFLLVAPKR